MCKSRRATNVGIAGGRPARFKRAVVACILTVAIAVGVLVARMPVSLAVTAAPAAPTPTSDVRFEPVGLFNIVEAPGTLADQPVAEVPLRLHAAAGPVKGAVRIEDIFGRPVGSPQEFSVAATSSSAIGATLKLGVGCYRVTGDLDMAGRRATPTMDVAVVPAHQPGLRPDSFLAVSTSLLRTGDELRLLQRIGIKVQRVAAAPAIVSNPPEVATGAPLDVDLGAFDGVVKESEAADVSVLPIATFSFPGTASAAARALGAPGPPRDFDEFTRTWEPVLKRHPEIVTWQFWNEPQVFGPMWAGSAEEYRRLLTKWCVAARKASPKSRLLAGIDASAAEDLLEPYPTAWLNLLDGIVHRPAAGADVRTMRDGATARSLDYGAAVARRMGLPYYYVDGAACFRPDEPDEGATACLQAVPPHAGNAPVPRVASNPWHPDGSMPACRLVQFTVRAALAGAYQVSVPWEGGVGTGRTRSSAAVAVLAAMIEDRPVVAEIWPANERLVGAVFAHPRHVTDAVRRLPRAGELAGRWAVPVPDDRAADGVKVAVLWSHTGRSAAEPDVAGTLTLDDPGGLKAYDLAGREIPAAGGKLTVSLGEAPVYVTTDALNVIEFRSRLAAGRIEHVTPVNLYALSLTRPAAELQKLYVRVENQLNREVRGTLTLRVGEGGETTEAPLVVPAAGLVEVAVPWPGAKRSSENAYAVTLTAHTDAGDVSCRQTVAVATFLARTIRVDGDLADWAGATPVVLDSDRLAGLAVGLSPGTVVGTTAGSPTHPRIVAKVYTAYDDSNVYLAAEVRQDQFTWASGRPAVRTSPIDGRAVMLPYKQAVPDGLGSIRLAGDAFIFAFGFRDRASGWGRPMDSPWAWKGNFYDTDFLYAAHASTDGDRLLRLWGPDTTRRGAYQGERVSGVGLATGAKLVIRRDEKTKTTIYEMSIPRIELYLFDPTEGRCRFSFVLANSEGLGRQGGLEWAEAAGVFDFWRTLGSFAPSSLAHLPCQTFFGIERAVPAKGKAKGGR